MIQLYKRMQKMREKYIDTLSKLYDYATTVYSKKQYTQWYDTKKGGYTYSSFKGKCDSLSKKLTQYGIGAGDKVAILSQSMPNWSVAFFSVVPFGRIAIPILPDSSPNEITNILEHSESKVIFVSQKLASKVSQECREKMTLVIDLDTFDVIKSDDNKFTCDGRTTVPTPDDIATIIYTSGTMGTPKGVMLTHRNILSVIEYLCPLYPIDETHDTISYLPLSHIYERTVQYCHVYLGCSTYYVDNLGAIVETMGEVKPHHFSSVPRLIEKVYHTIVRKGQKLTGIKKAIFFWALNLAERYDETKKEVLHYDI